MPSSHSQHREFPFLGPAVQKTITIAGVLVVFKLLSLKLTLNRISRHVSGSKSTLLLSSSITLFLCAEPTLSPLQHIGSRLKQLVGTHTHTQISKGRREIQRVVNRSLSCSRASKQACLSVRLRQVQAIRSHSLKTA